MWMSRMVSPREDDMGDALVGTALVGAIRPVSKKKSRADSGYRV